ncbi:MAG TPA: PaeR7I family type II restriction endonuclease [Blastocatellia bacterium]|nr:PaeR7I family type II restriction endonuclease [Blastocatellia bacterium]
MNWRVNKPIRHALREAVKYFWMIHREQTQENHSRTRGRSVRRPSSGAAMNKFIHLLCDLLNEFLLDVYIEKNAELPGGFRPEKKWDLLIFSNEILLAAIDLKSPFDALESNYDRLTEEAIGSATDLWAGYREGAFKPSARPWLGYLMLLEESPLSTRPVKAVEPHFKVFPEFKGASYAKRYELLLLKLVRERLYDSACLILSEAGMGLKGNYKEPIEELNFKNFVTSLLSRALAITQSS